MKIEKICENCKYLQKIDDSPLFYCYAPNIFQMTKKKWKCSNGKFIKKMKKKVNKTEVAKQEAKKAEIKKICENCKYMQDRGYPGLSYCKAPGAYQKVEKHWLCSNHKFVERNG